MLRCSGTPSGPSWGVARRLPLHGSGGVVLRLTGTPSDQSWVEFSVLPPLRDGCAWTPRHAGMARVPSWAEPGIPLYLHFIWHNEGVSIKKSLFEH